MYRPLRKYQETVVIKLYLYYIYIYCSLFNVIMLYPMIIEWFVTLWQDVNSDEDDEDEDSDAS